MPPTKVTSRWPITTRPRAERQAAIPDDDYSTKAAEAARRLGAPFKVYDNDKDS